MSAVIVMNSTYETISRTKLGRALNLVINGHAVIEEADPERLVRHKAGSFPWPKIIRMLRYIKVPYRFGAAPWTKRGVIKRDGGKCGYCLKPATTVDHIVPQSRGGASSWLNTVAACAKCNCKKADRTPREAHLTLRFEPYEPKQLRLAVH